MAGLPRGLILACAAACVGASAPARSFDAVVTHVTDGDTLWVRSERGAKPLEVRLRGIDAPERCQAGGLEATAALAARVLHRQVRVHTQGKDNYQRSLGEIQLSGDDVNAWMVARGHAWSYRHRRDAGPYAAQEGEARRARRGLFADPRALEPRLFRKQHGPCP